jgi:tripartite ATP-independent transporter DctP family solute receptor
LKAWHAAFLLPMGLLGYGLYLGLVSPQERAKVLRLGHVLNRTHPVHKGMEYLAEDLHRRSGGALRIDIFPDEQLGPERDLIEMLQVGSLGLTKVSAGVLENFSATMSVFSLPYLFRDREHFWRVADGPIGEELLDACVPYRLKGLCYYDAGARSFYINKKTGTEVQRPDDLAGLAIRVMKSRSAVRMLEVLGGKPVPIPFGELYTALNTGVVDGAENNPPTLYSSRQYEVAATYCLDEHTRVPDVLVISVDAWERLTGQQQRWVKASARASSVYQRELWQRAEQESLEAMVRSGLEVVTDVDKEAFRDKAAAMYRDPEYGDPQIQDLIRRIVEGS